MPVLDEPDPSSYRDNRTAMAVGFSFISLAILLYCLVGVLWGRLLEPYAHATYMELGYIYFLAVLFALWVPSYVVLTAILFRTARRFLVPPWLGRLRLCMLVLLVPAIGLPWIAKSAPDVLFAPVYALHRREVEHNVVIQPGELELLRLVPVKTVAGRRMPAPGRMDAVVRASFNTAYWGDRRVKADIQMGTGNGSCLPSFSQVIPQGLGSLEYACKMSLTLGAEPDDLRMLSYVLSATVIT